MFEKIRENIRLKKEARLEKERLEREAEQKRLEREKQIRDDILICYHEAEMLIKEGKINLVNSEKSSIILDNSEQLIFEANAKLIETRNVNKVQQYKEIDSGKISITNKKLIFSTTGKIITINLNKIIKLETADIYNENIPTVAINKDGVQKTQYFAVMDTIEIPMEVEGRQYNIPFNSNILLWFIKYATNIK